MMSTFTNSLSLSICHTCSSVSSLRLCSCGQVAYCTKSCQQKDWTRHKQDCPMVVIREIEGKGKGLVAIRNISPGTVIFTEEPLVAFKTEDLPWVEFQQFKKMKLGRFQEFMELYDPMQMDSTLSECPDPEYDKFCRIVGANGISSDDKELNGVYGLFSRINHSCIPNVSVEWVLLEMEVRAVRTVRKGEELVFNYVGVLGLGGTWKDRNDLLQRNWYFDCKCQVCSLTGKEREMNDQARKLIVSQMEKIEKKTKDATKKNLNPKVYLSTTLSDLLETLAACYENQVIFELPMLLCHCHMTYQIAKSAGIKWNCPGGVMKTLTDKLGENFLEELEKNTMDATIVLDRSKKEFVRQMLDQFRARLSSK